MAYKDYVGNTIKDEGEIQEVDAMFFSRPLVLKGGAFGSLNFFFDPTETSPQEIEHISHMITDMLDKYWEEKESQQRVTN